ncbi:MULTISPECIES: TIGR04376 family protein [unclassified Coleofasciculus]|uniref:TIGR04376 family protein n=1 Tax=unclassified Coleofasciculus TaxID=2692782 RepID=UPI00187FD626|nr:MULTISPECIES: TIGR04376 family protein [unclassified Coleofasciculus]MBE9127289.1 TIGR04376 family protein [Coleofasciculus sp. LEGE 07081]MBE9150559.1 TIGR04376 family protein [Coleofasciculus sp. LEGE 07092]
MGLFEDLNRFLENRLDEFLRNNPHLELQALEEQLREQEEDTLRLIVDLQLQEKRSQDEILAVAQEIQRWHERVNKANSNGRPDLAQAAQQREANLLHQGNQLWGKMEGVKQRLAKTKELQRQIQTRRTEVRTKAKEAEATRAKSQTQSHWETSAWNQSPRYNIGAGVDPLDAQFRQWETEEELERMKRNMGR